MYYKDVEFSQIYNSYFCIHCKSSSVSTFVTEENNYQEGFYQYERSNVRDIELYGEYQKWLPIQWQPL